ncbi:transmembrane protein, putative (macronuclear) [Tetrahymena thermophila SB210]|uniref:Transmembrane protein, putative n=1 Tax=Tetrahymena thermophila (strain SB210) TaxID=312017 RepID=Q22CV1_TETTS|nr:transmembrane protein, putative [Tetrahymena thermophila SB210]EAR83087.2 transmembrane protein, putative [Tetrahymena thermophila SB210]|eukprot:XP_001030750.2 transmembrane protein, putative [Tetrahymena thermophila SB210]
MIQLTYIFFGLAMIFVSLYVGMSLTGKAGKFFKKGKKLGEIEEEYERLRDQLRNLKHHYYWAQSNGEKTKEKQMEKQIFEVEDKLEQLYEEYQILKKGGSVPLKNIPKNQ